MPRPLALPSASRARRALIPSGSAVGLALSLSLVLSLALVRPAVAQGAEALTLQTALARAMSGNAELAAARRELEAAEGPVLQSGVSPNPQLSLLLEDTRRATRTSTLQLEQTIELGGKRSARLAAAERGRDVAAAELAVKRADVRASVVAAYHEVLMAQEHAALAGHSAELARRAAEAAGKRVQAGKVSPVEETKARVAEAAARMDAAQAASELRAARQRLASTWGETVPRFERVQPDASPAAELPPVPTPEAIGARIAASPSLQRARIEVERRRALSDLERARRTVDPTVTLGVKRDEQLGFNQAVIGVSIPLPLFDRNQGHLLEAMRREDKSRDELIAADLQLRSALMRSLGQLDLATTQARALRDEVLPGAQSAYDAASKGFELGKFAFLEVLDAQRTLFQAQSQYLRARGDAHRAAADIDRWLGDARPQE